MNCTYRPVVEPHDANKADLGKAMNTPAAIPAYHHGDGNAP